jgi:predicted deacylase
VLAVPIVNSFGFLNHTRYTPDRRDLNRCFPGSDRGSLASQAADIFFREVVPRCRYGIDYHTAALHRTNLPIVNRGDAVFHIAKAKPLSTIKESGETAAALADEDEII